VTSSNYLRSIGQDHKGGLCAGEGRPAGGCMEGAVDPKAGQDRAPAEQALDELSPQPSQPVSGLGVLRPHSRSHPGPHIARNAGWLPSSQPRWPAIIPAVPRPNRRRCVLFGCVEAPAWILSDPCDELPPARRDDEAQRGVSPLEHNESGA
jgi:hypothetical protein